MTANRFATAQDATAYMLAGNATVTFRSTKTDARFTFKISKSDDGRVSFVSLLSGSDNENDFAYMGIINAHTDYRQTQKSRISSNAPSAKAFAWAWPLLASGYLPAALEVWHEGSCGRCGRKLTVPESIASGIGPECAKRTFVAEAA